MFRIKSKNLILFLAIFVPTIVVFRSIFSNLSLSWGDAPFFYKEGLVEVFKEPSSWTNRDVDLGGVNNLLWMSPLMLFYGLLGKFGISNGVIVRILFYLPSLVFSVIGPVLLTRYLKLGKVAQFFSSLIFVFNTYYLVLVDGGQVGIALSYGIFPLTLLFLKKFLDQPKRKNFYTALFGSFILGVVDPRILAIVFLTVTLWQLLEIAFDKKTFPVKQFLLLTFSLVGLSMYWIYPTLKTGGGMSGFSSSISTISLKNALALYQPHFPANEYGVLFPMPIYFYTIPLIVFSGVFLVRSKSYYTFLILYLLFAFLAKGGQFPFGNLYKFLVEKVPFGLAFRDSSKFLIPTIFFVSILTGKVIERLFLKIKKAGYQHLLLSACYLLLLLPVYPAFLNKLNFNLSTREVSRIDNLKRELTGEGVFFRSVWFPEKYPLVFQEFSKPALNANSLVNLRPFSVMNVGTEDSFNFLNNPASIKLFDVLGMKYLVFSGDRRNLSPNEQNEKLWSGALNAVQTLPLLEKTGFDGIQVYKLSESKPRIYGVDKIVAVIGGDDLYERLNNIDNLGLVFLEDGFSNPSFLENVDADSVELFFNGEEKQDFVFSLSDDKGLEAKKSDWAFFLPRDYRLWKYQLLIRGLDVKDFTFNSPTFLSTSMEESVSFGVEREMGDYTLAVRSLTDDLGNSLDYSLSGNTGTLKYKREGKFGWLLADISLNSSTDESLIIKNNGGLHSINLVLLLPREEFERLNNLSQDYLDKFKVLEFDQLQDEMDTSRWHDVETGNPKEFRYELKSFGESKWIIFTDSFSPMWFIDYGSQSLNSNAAYSSINTFYLGEGEKVAVIRFKGQDYFRSGLVVSLSVAVVIGLEHLWFYLKGKKREKF